MALNVWESFDKLVYYNVRILLMGAPVHPGFFPGVGKLRVQRRKSPSAVQGVSLSGGPGTKPPEADDRL